ncbi:hypothetical protein [Corynebacterium crudilactis]|uniref:DAGKc domain-containing protein n=1 Tax=Corynebacterium crudilactis TaxID=1652495 RepID=A0A172QWA6_9CORY|nr:hypothetical protein [Corynebacterium crudilactis]ANE04931.1 hypothetical protein ccrud_12475 [Corynebacterium crudilactis]
MRLLVLRCNSPHITDFSVVSSSVEIHDLPAVPSRKDLKIIDDAAFDVLPHDPTPSLDEIAKQPDVAHLSTPQIAPQQPETRLRIVVIGSDAALSAVLTRLMRADNLWAEIGFVPVGPSTAAKNWGLPTEEAEAVALALQGTVHPVPLIRDDAAVAIAGSATITNWEPGEITGEIIVDDHVLIRHEATVKAPRRGIYGARLVPMLDAPGIAAVTMDTPLPGDVPSRGLFPRPTGSVIPKSFSTGRAMQAGGPTLRIRVDGISRKRMVERVTFYRHLRDLQIVRP